jgi:hypothetical protein
VDEKAWVNSPGLAQEERFQDLLGFNTIYWIKLIKLLILIIIYYDREN